MTVESGPQRETENTASPFDRIGVVGAKGQTGRLYMERFASGFHDLKLAAIDPSEREINFAGNVELFSDVAEALNQEDRPEALILATTNPTDKLLETIANNLDGRPLTLILPQNGVDVVGKAQKALAGKNVTLIRASLFSPVSTNEDGSIKYDAKKLRIGLSLTYDNSDQASDKDKAELEKAKTLFEKSGFDARKFEDYKSMEWTKLVLNAVGITGGVTGLTPEEVYADHDLYLLETQALHDRIRILKAAGIKLEHIPWGGASLLPVYDGLPGTVRKSRVAQKLYGGKVTAGRGNKPSSVATNIAKGASTEAFFYLQPFIDLGKQFGLRSAVDEAILDILKRNETMVIRRKGDVDVEEKELDLADFSADEKRTLLFTTYQRLTQKPPSRLDRIEGKLLNEAGRKLFRYEIVDPHHYADRVIDVLHPWGPEKEDKKPGGVVMGLNHSDMTDSVHGTEFIEDSLHDIERTVGLDTFWHYDETRGKIYTKLFNMLASKINAGTDLNTYHILREQDLPYYATHRGAIDGKTLEDFNKPSYRKAIERLRRGGILIIAPEGTRSLTGELNKAMPTELVLRAAGNRSVFLPIGLVPDSMSVPYDRTVKLRKIKRSLAKVEVRVGRPVTYKELQAELEAVNQRLEPLLPTINAGRDEKDQLVLLTVSDLMMLHIAKVLPENFWGYYREYMHLLKDVIN
jgi:ketopantoate reductase